MKKWIAILMAALTLCAVMTSCSDSNAALKDGTYRVEAKDFDDHGWKEYVVVTVSGEKITEVEFDALSKEDNHKKTEDQGYKDAYLGAGFETYPADYTEKLEKSLIEKQDSSTVDAVAGATHSSDSFKKMVTELQKSMKKGSTKTVVVDMSK